MCDMGYRLTPPALKMEVSRFITSFIGARWKLWHPKFTIRYSHTSKKTLQKKPQSFVHCRSFHHPDLHSLNDYNFLFFLVYELKFQKNWDLLAYRWKGLQNTLPTVYDMPQKSFKKIVVKEKRKICNHLVTADQGGLKNRNGKMTAVLFDNVFY